MTDLMDVLRNLPQAVGTAPAGPDIVAADVARGRHAVTRRRRRHLTLSGAAVAVVAAVTVGAAQLPGGPATDTGAGVVTAQATPMRLVAWTGEQPKGFTVRSVPDGWRVISDDASSFVVAPPGQGVTEPQPGQAFSVVDRIAVSLQGLSRFGADHKVRTVDINGEQGRLGFAQESEGKASDMRWLMFTDPSGRRVLVQIPASANLPDDQLVAFAEGITVTDQALEIGG
ncbi:hypothetical protein [Actinoplanes sp. M2I2]|uniref:hypothetical protein n=1 Tax=Actinoplanes sp. M2I2 TaxID=1734444 RepID=UPI00202035E9|nr:hypothetical protein [Actinoplanes sp. M2I2]